jgi:Tol biopolymer transport system component
MWVPRLGLVLAAALAAAVVLGCSGGGVSTPDDGSVTVALGDVQIAGASALQRVDFHESASSSVAFTGFYGGTITRFAQLGRGRICFNTFRDGVPGEIYVARPDGYGLTRITNNSDADEFPDWSPDGKTIAFATDRDGGITIYKMNADGSSPTRLTTATTADAMPSWSPDGKSIVFASNRDGDPEIYVMDANGANQTRLTNRVGRDLFPVWSPLNNEIAYVSDSAGNGDIYTMATDGSNPVALTIAPEDDIEPTWSPDGHSIAFSRLTTPTTGNIWRMSADGTNPVQLTNDSRDNRVPEWSPDGSRIMYRRGDQLWVMDSDGSDPRQVTTGTAEEDATVSWSGSTAHVVRSYIGAGASDSGADPPFGTERPLVIVGISQQGVAEAATIVLDKVHWGTVTATGLDGTGLYLAGVRIEAARIDAVLEDVGRGASVRSWNTSSGYITKSVVVFFSTKTGKIASVMAATVSAGAAEADVKPLARTEGSRVVVRGPFQAVWTAPGVNAAPSGAAEVEMDAATGEVVVVR